MGSPIIKITFNIVSICPDNRLCWKRSKNVAETVYANSCYFRTNIPPFSLLIEHFDQVSQTQLEKIKVL